MSEEQLKPTDEELQDAIMRAKQAPHNLTSSQIKHLDYGAGIVRSYLPERFHIVPLDEIRMWCESLSKAGKEPGIRKRTPEQKQAAALKSLVRAFPSNGDHTAEYDAIHRDPEYKRLRDGRKRALGFRCQLCSRVFMASELEGHIIDYSDWRHPGMMIIVCASECHPIIDALRRRGRQITQGEPALPLFPDLD